MRLTIVPDDKVVIVDGEGYFDVDVSSLDANIHAIQWYDTHGEIEFKDETNNEKIEDISFCGPVVSAWGIAKKKNHQQTIIAFGMKKLTIGKMTCLLKQRLIYKEKLIQLKSFWLIPTLRCCQITRPNQMWT